MRAKTSPIALTGLAVFLFALIFRLVGVQWGLKNDLHNASYHPDEPVIFGYSRAIVPGQAKFLPHFYNYGTLYLTALRVASDITTTYTGPPKVQGDGWSWQHPEKTDWDWVSRCDLAGRLLSALAGAGTALLLFLTMKRTMGDAAGVIAGMFVAIAPAHLVHSRFQTVDVTATFFVAAALYYCVKIAEDPEESTLLISTLLAGLFIGLSAGTKYTGAIAVLSLITALSLRRPTKGIVLGLAGLGVTAAAFLATTPGALLETDVFMQGVAYEMKHTATEHGLVFVGTPNGFVYHLLNLFVGVGPIPVLLGVAGLAWAAYRKHRWAVVMLVFFLAYYLVIGRAEVKFIRYTFPLYVGLACGFGYAMVACHRRKGWARIGVGIGIFGAGGFPYGGLTTSLAMTRGMLEQDPRDAAAQYLKTLPGPVGFPANSWFWSPPLFPDAVEPNSVPEPERLYQMQNVAKPPIAFVTNPDGSPTEWSPDLIQKLKPPVIAFSSFQSFPIFRLRGATGLPPAVQPQVTNDSKFLDLLERDYEQDRAFGQENLDQSHPELLAEDFLYTKPVVWVWKRKTTTSP